MNYSMEEERSEEQDYTPLLSDDAIFLILSELSWKDILNVKLVSRRFYGIIHEKYQQLNRRTVHGILIKYNKNYKSYPIRLDIIFDSVIDGDSRIIPFSYHRKIINIQSGEELSKLLKMFDLKNFNYLVVPATDDFDIFDIMGKSFQIGTKISALTISKVAEKDFRSFRVFIEKFSSIKNLCIEHICSPSTEAKDIYLDLSLSSLDTIEHFCISECNATKILSVDMVTKLLERNLNLKSLDIGTWDIEFIESLFKKFFTMEQPCKTVNKCDYGEINLSLFFRGEFEHLCEILRNDLNQLEDVEEIEDTLFPWEGVVFESSVYYKYCLKDKNGITRCVRLWNGELDRPGLNH
uniref:F-box domain-containing protein n=1 Tax=Strongyloides papillosus TaxID=174720 RepID=A0A0N5C0L4_STREA